LAWLEKKNFEINPFSHIARSPHGHRMPRICAGYAGRQDYKVCEAVMERPLGRHVSKTAIPLFSVRKT
jgi:hypothetical protein